MSRRLRRTKIVTTLGPATDRDNNLEKIIAAGANVGHGEQIATGAQRPERRRRDQQGNTTKSGSLPQGA